jgi:predicted metal-dependent peptidase
MDQNKVTKVKNKLNLLRSGLMKTYPFILSFLENLKIVVTEAVPTAGVSKDTIAINPDYFLGLNNREAEFVLVHEALHIAMFDIYRFETLAKIENAFSHESWNIAADVVNNEMIFNDLNVYYSQYLSYETIHGIGYPKNRSGTKDDIYKWLLERAQKSKNICNLSSTDKMMTDEECENAAAKGQVVYEGEKHKEFSKSTNKPEEYERELKEAVARSYNYSKTIGNTPAGLDRAIHNILGSKLDWRSLLRNMVNSELSRFIVTTYKRRNRRCKVLPGINKYSFPDIRVLLDTSGSISPNELEQFISEIYQAARITQSKIYIYPFDAQSYEKFVIKKPSDVLRAKIKGGGGTVIGDTLWKVKREMGRNDIIIIMSDDGIWDADKTDVTEMIKELKPIYVSTVEGRQWDWLKERKIILSDF